MWIELQHLRNSVNYDHKIQTFFRWTLKEFELTTKWISQESWSMQCIVMHAHLYTSLWIDGVNFVWNLILSINQGVLLSYTSILSVELAGARGPSLPNFFSIQLYNATALYSLHGDKQRAECYNAANPNTVKECCHAIRQIQDRVDCCEAPNLGL